MYNSQAVINYAYLILDLRSDFIILKVDRSKKYVKHSAIALKLLLRLRSVLLM
jgi:hypothetical protein